MSNIDNAINERDFDRFNFLIQNNAADITDHTLTIALRTGHPHFITRIFPLGALPNSETLTEAIKQGHAGWIQKVIALGALPNNETLPEAMKKGHAGWIKKVEELLLTRKDFAEVRKNSRIISQGQRDTNSMFSTLPNEVLEKIAAKTKGRHLTEKEAEKIARCTWIDQRKNRNGKIFCALYLLKYLDCRKLMCNLLVMYMPKRLLRGRLQ